MTAIRIGEMLIDRNLVSATDVTQALVAQAEIGG